MTCSLYPEPDKFFRHVHKVRVSAIEYVSRFSVQNHSPHHVCAMRLSDTVTIPSQSRKTTLFFENRKSCLYYSTLLLCMFTTFLQPIHQTWILLCLFLYLLWKASITSKKRLIICRLRDNYWFIYNLEAHYFHRCGRRSGSQWMVYQMRVASAFLTITPHSFIHHFWCSIPQQYVKHLMLACIFPLAALTRLGKLMRRAGGG
jgi:hypothetical protein